MILNSMLQNSPLVLLALSAAALAAYGIARAVGAGVRRLREGR